ncbi:MAG: GH3 auxin-responsive promoter [Bacteroidetes bacterium]|nr:MAG: GH3 auxin-responsive promoter [Bacteroidota bacterium]REK35479.1 MAG: GH3 auxin-responsive promoter [Bacteroidota bacterium]REK46837.1 MAG: GH3 auxin-responsive promoter [Bacteroidota bacterium]
MALIGALIKQGLKLSTSVKLPEATPAEMQRKELKKLLKKASQTAFGKHYRFDEILKNRDVIKAFQEKVKIYDYNSIHQEWWHRCLQEEKDVCWPGHIKYFALSSGTSESASKHIPVTSEMIRAMKKASIRQILTLGRYNLPASFFEKGILWLGGSTDLKKQGGYFEGDVSGISAANVPIWFQKYYKPGKKISRQKDWNVKLDEITEQAPNWDIGIITGVPAWVQLLLEKIIERYKLRTIHDMWPNLHVYAHGGVSFEPYRKVFSRFFERPVHYIEMYPASEGFIAFQFRPDVKSMKLILNNGIFYEFIPFNDTNFDSAGDLRPDAQALSISEVKEGEPYALLMSTCAGAWRYLIGDVVEFTDLQRSEMKISGRTKHFLSLVGEHLSVDNMNRAVEQISREMNLEIPEYTVTGIPFEGTFAHQWYLGINGNADEKRLRDRLDEILKELNDDYAVERGSALKEVIVHTVPADKFYNFMQSRGKMGGQNKFPRVLKQQQHEEWKNFLASA